MSTNTIIAIAAISTLVIGILIHSWLHKIIKFKMDESSIVQHFRDSSTSNITSLEALATAALLSEKRTLEICIKSTLLSSSDDGLWSLKN